MIELLIGAGVGVALTAGFQQFTKGNGTLLTRMKENEMAVSQAFQDLATNIEALPGKLTASVQAQLDAANATIASMEQDAADNLAAAQKAVSDVTPSV